MRGKPWSGLWLPWLLRIIPAHAGQTWGIDADTPMMADHPRTCGANDQRGRTSSAVNGSSPHMRGKRYVRSNGLRSSRIIPAHAGQTSRRASRTRRTPDHPRTCGANGVPSVVTVYASGSSPHMRGKPADKPPAVRQQRIIPAHAGQTSRASRARGADSDHPRTCGANVMNGSNFINSVGSSPHMRGKRMGAPIFWARSRIIPAHAGQTTCWNADKTRAMDHPRTCGANSGTVYVAKRPHGSSPHMRGKLDVARITVVAGRIIPAHAGQTLFFSKIPMNFADHPRTCGANRWVTSARVPSAGSSPHMRGKQSDSISKTLSDNTRKIRFAQSATLR